MALIKCPECGKEVSDRAKACIHCGCPLDIADSVIEEQNNYQVFLTDVGRELVKVIATIREITGISLKDAKMIVDCAPSLIVGELSKEKALEIQRLLKGNGASVEIKQGNSTVKDSYFTKDDTLICPKCKSTQVTTGSRGFTLMTGFLGSNKTVNRCGKCGYTWKP